MAVETLAMTDLQAATISVESSGTFCGHDSAAL